MMSGQDSTQAAISSNQTGTDGGYYYSFWTNGSGSANMTLDGSNGYSVTWSNIGDFTCGKGWNPGSSHTISYTGSYSNSGGGAFGIYGWTTNPLVEYYIVESPGSSGSPGQGTQVGTVTSDGATYTIWKHQQVNQPSIQGTSTFWQYISVRQSPRASGTITIANHFNAWAQNGMNLGSHNYQILLTESWSGSGNASAKISEGGGGGGTCSSAPSAPSGLTTNVVSSSQINLSWSAVSPPSNCSVTYSVFRNGTQVASGLTSTSYSNTGLSASTSYQFYVKAVDSAGSSANSSTVSATTQAGGGTSSGGTSSGGGTTGAVSINCGGPATGNFVADADYSGGSTYSTGNSIDTSLISGTVPPQAVFQSERYGASTYTIPGLTAGGAYTVTLYFAESYVSAAGQRLFNVAINGSTVLSAFDIFATAGAQNRAVAKTFNATANGSGQVVIALTAGSIQNPKISGITVAAGGGGGTSSGGTSSGGTSSGGTSSGGTSSGGTSSGGTSSGGGGSCNAASGGQSGNFNTTGAICFTVTGTINGWGCSNNAGRTLTVNGTAVTCGQMPLPGSSPYTFSFSAGTYSYASFYWW